MPIVEEYDAIAKRMRELQASSPKSADQLTELEGWRDAALQTARAYVEDRRCNRVPRRFLPQPTD